MCPSMLPNGAHYVCSICFFDRNGHRNGYGLMEMGSLNRTITILILMEMDTDTKPGAWSPRLRQGLLFSMSYSSQESIICLLESKKNGHVIKAGFLKGTNRTLSYSLIIAWHLFCETFTTRHMTWINPNSILIWIRKKTCHDHSGPYLTGAWAVPDFPMIKCYFIWTSTETNSLKKNRDQHENIKYVSDICIRQHRELLKIKTFLGKNEIDMGLPCHYWHGLQMKVNLLLHILLWVTPGGGVLA